MIASVKNIQDLSKFSYVRVIRSMPQLRPISPSLLRSQNSGKIQLPIEKALDPNIKVAVFDGGLPDNSILGKWVTSHKTKLIGKQVLPYVNHGSNVTSALLFGSIDSAQSIVRPFSNVSHYQVIDEKTGKNNDLFDVLDRIMDVLNNNNYEFINISIGPDLPIEDNDVNVWTATLDDYLSSGRVLATIAAGNTGDADGTFGLNRIQPPSDSVNVLSVGACDSLDNDWKRASYSSIGPGRSPGYVKPDGLAFGGSIENPFHVINPYNETLLQVMGTSYAAPSVLRTAIGIRALLGNTVQPLVI